MVGGGCDEVWLEVVVMGGVVVMRCGCDEVWLEVVVMRCGWRWL